MVTISSVAGELSILTRPKPEIKLHPTENKTHLAP